MSVNRGEPVARYCQWCDKPQMQPRPAETYQTQSGRTVTIRPAVTEQDVCWARLCPEMERRAQEGDAEAVACLAFIRKWSGPAG